MTIHIELPEQECDVEPSDYIDTLNAMIKDRLEKSPDDLRFELIMPVNTTIGRKDSPEDDYTYRKSTLPGGTQFHLWEAYVGRSHKVIFRFIQIGVGEAFDGAKVAEMNGTEATKVFGPKFSGLIDAIGYDDYIKTLRSASRKARKKEKEAKIEEIKNQAADPEWSHIGSW